MTSVEEAKPDPIVTVQIKETTPSRSKRRLFFLFPPVERRPAFWRRLAYEVPLVAMLGVRLVAWYLSSPEWRDGISPLAITIDYWVVLLSIPVCWVFLALSRAKWWHFALAPIWILGIWIVVEFLSFHL